MRYVISGINEIPARDPFLLHRHTLLPLLAAIRELNPEDITAMIEKTGLDRFLTFIRCNGLAPLWHKLLRDLSGTTDLLENMKEMLHQDRVQAVATYLLQKHTLDKLHTILMNENIRYAVCKGAQVREFLYTEPALRPATDIDVLIHPDRRDKTIKVLTGAGMQPVITPENLSHECTFLDNKVQIDLHWQILRPGRIQQGITNELLLNPKMIRGFWGMNDCATMFVSLVHPAYTRHVCNPYALLIRLVDLFQLIETNTIDWDKVMELLSRAHARTAAWTTLFWLNHLVAITRGQKIMLQLTPPALRRNYLEFWISNNLPSRLVSFRRFVRLAFTLALHDNNKDAINAIITGNREKRLARNELDYLTGNHA